MVLHPEIPQACRAVHPAGCDHGRIELYLNVHVSSFERFYFNGCLRDLPSGMINPVYRLSMFMEKLPGVKDHFIARASPRMTSDNPAVAGCIHET